MHSNQAAENGILDTTSTTFGGSTMTTRIKNRSAIFDTGRKLAVSVLALGLALGSSAPALADITNTVTVTGSSPAGTDDVTNSAIETVDPVNAAPVLTVTKVASDDTEVAAGATVTYTYTVTNSGNVGVTNLSLSDNHNSDAFGLLGTITLTGLTNDAGASLLDSTDDTADNDWDYIAPGDTITWTATYTVLQADITGQSVDGDGNLDNTVTASGGYFDSTNTAQVATGVASEEVDLEDRNASLLVAKVADDDTEVTLGQIITYTYTVTNNGNVPVTAISLGDVHNGSGADPVPDADAATLTDNGTALDSSNGTAGNGEWEVLAPGDVLTVTATYVVTQSDIDNLQ